MNIYFYDTYALYQIARGVESYSPFTKKIKLVTTLLNVYELYYTLRKEGQNSLSDAFFNQLLPCCIKIDPEDIKLAADFRLANTKKKLSYIDALGYTLAVKHNISFLTGDKAFSDIENVTYVK